MKIIKTKNNQFFITIPNQLVKFKQLKGGEEIFIALNKDGDIIIKFQEIKENGIKNNNKSNT